MSVSESDRGACDIVLFPHRVSMSQSAIYTIIPSVVRSRIPILGSLRESVRHVITKPAPRERSLTDPIPSSEDGTRYRFSRAASATNGPMRPSTPEEFLTGGGSLTFNGRPDSSVVQSDMTAGGIDWEIAGAGVRLWIAARQKLEQGAPPATLRCMHIDALRYMHAALPSDLTAGENEILQNSIPPHLLVQQEIRHPSSTSNQSSPNILRQGVARTVCWLVTLIMILIPFCMKLLEVVMRYEREHRLAERAINNSAEMTKALAGRGLDAGDAFLKFKDSPSGTACAHGLSWLIEGVAGGVNDGLLRSTNGAVTLISQ